MGAQDLLSIVLTPDAISEVSQYKSRMESLYVSPKHVKLPPQKDNLKVI